MSTYGLTDQGFVTKPLSQILADIESDQLQNIASDLDQSADEPLGQINGIFAAALAELWQVTQAVDASGDPDQATGDSLAELAALTGTKALEPTKTSVQLLLVGAFGTVVPAGSVAAVTSVPPGEGFETQADSAAFGSFGATAWTGTHAYTQGALVTNGGNTYVCASSGTSASTGGPTGTGAGIVDGSGSLTWDFVGTGTSATVVTALAQDTGPIAANAGTVTTIRTPVSGWASVYNLLDGTRGRDAEVDQALRLRREVELRATGNSAADAIRAKLLDPDVIAGVTAAEVFENDTDATVGSLPPHSFESVVLGGTNDDVAQTIWNTKPAGIQTYGTSSGTATDAAGNAKTVNFSRPTEEDVYFIFGVSIDASKFPSDGDAQIADAAAAFGADNFSIGDDVVLSRFYASVFGIAGVLDVTYIKAGFAPSPSGTSNLAITDHQVAGFDSSRVSCVHV